MYIYAHFSFFYVYNTWFVYMVKYRIIVTYSLYCYLYWLTGWGNSYTGLFHFFFSMKRPIIYFCCSCLTLLFAWAFNVVVIMTEDVMKCGYNMIPLMCLIRYLVLGQKRYLIPLFYLSDLERSDVSGS